MRLKDRLLLGALCGVLGNIPKSVWDKGIAINYLGAEIDGVERAAGMLVPGHQVMTPKGQTVGWIADFIMASILGVLMAYALSLTGENKATLKGTFTGQAAWTAFYGVMSTMGATTVKAVSPQTVLTELVGHTLYGTTTAALLTALGSHDLWNGKIPLFASTAKTKGLLGALLH